jgi:predicted RNase H-like HicB family nuclease
MPAMYYPAIIDRSATSFGVTFPDFPGCIANGATMSDAAINAEAALALHVESMIKDKDPLPGPSDFATAEHYKDDVARVLIRVEAPVKVERVLLSLDSNVIRAIDAVASNRSAFMAEAARAHIAGSHKIGDKVRRLLAHYGVIDVFLAVAIDEPSGKAPSARAAFERLRVEGGSDLDYHSDDFLPEVAAAHDAVRNAAKQPADELALASAVGACRQLQLVAASRFYNAVQDLVGS